MDLRTLLRRGDFTGLRRLLLVHAAGGGLTEYLVSGNPAVFETNVQKKLTGLKIPFEPIQDLHGQDAPYPPGGGKNKVGYLESGTFSESQPVGTTYQLMKSANTARIRTANLIPTNGNQFTVSADFTNYNVCMVMFDENQQYIGKTDGFRGWSYSNFTYTGTGIYYVALAVKRTDGGTMPESDMENCKLQLEFSSSATSYAPYSNICPITGITGLNVIRTGKNLISRSDGVTSGSNWWLGSSSSIDEPDGSLVLGAGTYTFSASDAQNGLYVRKNGKSVATAYNKTSVSFTLTERTPIKLMLYKSGAQTSYWDTLNIQVEIDSTATSYEPYTGTTIPVTFPAVGKNLFDKDSVVSVSNKYLNNDGVETSYNGTNYTKMYIPVEPSTQYTFQGYLKTSEAEMYVGVYFFDSEKTFITRSIGADKNVNGWTFTTPAGCAYVDIQYRSTWQPDTIQLEKGSSATSYEPYTNTVYGGELDAVTGVLTVDWASKNISTLNFSPSTPENHVFRTDSLGSVIKLPANNATSGEAKSDKFSIMAYTPITASDNGKFAIASTGYPGRVIFIDHRYSTEESFVSGNVGTQLVYRLATPLVFQLDPVEVATLLGTNVLYTDTNGTNEIKYLKKG